MVEDKALLYSISNQGVTIYQIANISGFLEDGTGGEVSQPITVPIVFPIPPSHQIPSNSWLPFHSWNAISSVSRQTVTIYGRNTVENTNESVFASFQLHIGPALANFPVVGEQENSREEQLVTLESCNSTLAPLFLNWVSEDDSEDEEDSPPSVWTPHQRAWVSSHGRHLFLLLMLPNHLPGPMVTTLSAFQAQSLEASTWEPALGDTDVYAYDFTQTHFSDTDSVLGALVKPCISHLHHRELHLFSY